MENKPAKKILIVEDENELLLGLSTLLKSQGYAAITASDALFGISLAHKENPDLIILDLGLPAGGGLHVLESINKSTTTNDIPVIILTAQQGKELEAKFRLMGVDEYFHKPFEPELLLNKIKEILNK